MENHIMPAVAWARKPVEKAPAHCLGLADPAGGLGEYARVRSRLTGSPGTAFHRQPKFAPVDCSTRGHVEQRCLPRTPSVGQRRGRSLPESHPPASDRQANICRSRMATCAACRVSRLIGERDAGGVLVRRSSARQNSRSWTFKVQRRHHPAAA